jgi:hypothetical protein
MSISRMRRVQLVPSCKPHPLVGGVIDPIISSSPVTKLFVKNGEGCDRKHIGLDGQSPLKMLGSLPPPSATT